MTTVPALPHSPYGESVSADTFTVSDHKVLYAFRNRLRRKAVWVVITPLHQQFIEALEIYRPFEVPGKAEPSWTMWPSAAGIWVSDREFGPLCEPTTIIEAIEMVEVILEGEIRRAIRAIPKATSPELPKRLCSNADCA
jgi:hypothetical protein